MRIPGTLNEAVAKAKKKKKEDLSQYDDSKYWTKAKKKK